MREFLFFIYNADKIYVEKRTAMLPRMLPYVQYHLLPDVSDRLRHVTNNVTTLVKILHFLRYSTVLQ